MAQLLTGMVLFTDFTPRTSCASFVTRDFSASEAASPVMLITPSTVVTFVLTALVPLWLRSAYFTWLVMEASSIFSPTVVPGAGASLTTMSFLTYFTQSMSLA